MLNVAATSRDAVSDRFATILRQARERRGLSQGELGVALGGLSQATVSLWERGETHPSNIEMIRKLERVLHATPGTLLAAAGYPVKLTAMTPEDAVEADASLRDEEKTALLTTLKAFRQRKGKAAS